MKYNVSGTKKIIIITDCTDIAYSEMHLSLVNALEQLNIKDYVIYPKIDIKAFSIVNAAFCIRLIAEVCPKDTLLVVVANATPLNPARIFGVTQNGLYFIGNNSGYFNWLFNDLGIEHIFKNDITREVNSISFGGKHVQIPTAAKLLSGVDFNEFGEEMSLTQLSDFIIADGTVVHCDNFGLMKIKYQKDLNLAEGQRLKIYINSKYVVDGVFSKKMKLQPDDTWVLFPGSSLGQMPELGKVRTKNSNQELGVQEGDIITWETIQ